MRAEWGKKERQYILMLHFVFYFKGSIICTWCSASGFHNNPPHWKTTGSANLQLSAFQGLLMEPRIPVRQAAHCWHVPGGLARGWEQSEVELCSEPVAICPLSILGDAATQETSTSSEAPWAILMWQAAETALSAPHNRHPPAVNLHEYSTHSIRLLNSCNLLRILQKHNHYS